MNLRLVIPLFLSIWMIGCNEIGTLPLADTVTTTPVAEKIGDQSASSVTEAGHAPLLTEALMTAFNEPPQTNGEALILYGQVVDVQGNAIPDAVVEIWQTDASGVYDHPQDPGTNNRDMTFQFFGQASTNENGWYAFRTIMPGRYEPRPRHIHFKVKQNENTLLTSQFYFSDDVVEVQDEGMFRAVGDSGDLLLLQLVQGEGQLLANGQIVVDVGIGAGSLPLTPSQGEGPYYPVVPLADFDHDLTILP